MDQVKIRAVVAAGGLRKHQEVTVAATPMVEGAIANGVFLELERYPFGPGEADLVDDTEIGEDPVPPIEEVELPEIPKPKAPNRRG